MQEVYYPFLRSITLLFDFAAIWILWKWLHKKIAYNLLLCICLLNVAFSYDTVFWGQVDGIEAALVFAAMYAACTGRILLSGLACVLAVNMKLQAVVFLPVWGLLVIPAVVRAEGRKQLIMMAGAMAALQLLILWPFAYGKGGWAAVWQVITGSLSNVPKLSVNAYNWWYWTTTDYPGNVPDDTIGWLGLTPKQWGLTAFFVLSAAALWPLMVITRRHLKEPSCFCSENDTRSVWLTAALVCLLFFFCNTEMHERYVHPAFLFLTAYAFKYNTFWLYALFSFAYLLNLEGAAQWLALPNYGTLIFDGRLIAGLYTVVIAGLFAALYRKAPIQPVL